MRNVLGIVLGIVIGSSVDARVTSAQNAKPGSRFDTATVSFDTGGVHVILRRNPANSVVAVNLYLLGGSQMVTESNAGIEPFLLELSERGTAHYSREELRHATAVLGSAIVVQARDDWTMFGFRGVRATFDSTWAIWSDRLMAGTLEPADIDFLREQVLTAVRQRNDDPEGLAHLLADSARFAGKPYSLMNGGTLQSVTTFTPQSLGAWRTANLVTSRMLLVVVGNVDREKVAKLVASTLGRLPRGEYQWTPPVAAPATAGPAVLVQQRLPTNYLVGYYIGPPASSSDAAALRVATAILSGRLFTEIRSRRNLTYDVNAPFSEQAITVGGLEVSTAFPDSTVELMWRITDFLKRHTMEAEQLRSNEQFFLTEYFLANETNAEQANQLARAQVYRGDYRLADHFEEDIRGVTPTAVQYVAQKYMRGFVWAYVGDTTKVTRAKLEGF